MYNMSMSESTLVTRALEEMGVSYRFFRHAGPIESLEQAAEERGQRPSPQVLSRGNWALSRRRTFIPVRARK